MADPQYFNVPKILVREPRLMVPRRVPVSRVRVDGSHRLAKGLKHCVVWGTCRSVDLLGNPLTYTGSNFVFGAGPAGAGLITAATSNTYVSIPMFAGTVADGLTIVVHQHAPTRNTAAGWLRYGGGHHSHWTYNNVIANDQGTNANVWSGITDETDFDFEKEVVVVMTSSRTGGNNNQHRIYIDGKLIKISDNVIDFPSYPTYAHLCGCTYKSFPGITYSNYAYDRALSYQEAIALSLDPYQFLIPA